MVDFYLIRELYEASNFKDEAFLESLETICLEGWVKTNRDNGAIGFIELNDGSYFKNIQLVYDKKAINNFDEVTKYLTGTAISVTGKFVRTAKAKQPFEIHCLEINLEGDCDETYPLQKKRHSLEYLREIPHLRVRTNTFMATMRLRSALAMSIHEFYQNQGFVYVTAPIITTNDAEGAGEAFTVTTRSDGDYSKDFFGQKTSLGVSGQLHAEAYALAFRDVYTFAPTFRAELSNTSRHAAEFWMVEPEIAFADLDDVMDLIEDNIKYCIEYLFKACPIELDFADQYLEKGLLTKLEKVAKAEFKKITYTQAIEELLKADADFEFPVEWGIDLASEHERYLCEKVFDRPLFVTDYPKDIKAFYMRLNDDGKTVAACDLLVPGVGELVGGSQREERYDLLKTRMEEMHMPVDELQWYLDLRKYGSVNHGGFGIGFERLLMYLTGIANIRDAIPYPRTPKNCLF